MPTIIKQGKTVWKPTIIDGQNGLVVFVNVSFIIHNIHIPFYIEISHY